MDATMTFDTLAPDAPANITCVAWDLLPLDDAKRLRALGIDEGAQVTILHRGVFGGRDPLAVRLGRMTVALRRAHASAIQVELDNAPSPADTGEVA